MRSISTKQRAPASRKTRIGRTSIPHQTYHVTTCTAHRRKVFAGLRAARILIGALRRQDKAHRTLTFAFVVMPDHLHWLVEIGNETTLPEIMSIVKSESAREINRVARTDTPVWQRGYFDRAMRREDDLVAVARYIVANPLRAGLAGTIGEYPHWNACWVR